MLETPCEYEALHDNVAVGSVETGPRMGGFLELMEEKVQEQPDLWEYLLDGQEDSSWTGCSG